MRNFGFYRKYILNFSVLLVIIASIGCYIISKDVKDMFMVLDRKSVV